MKVIINGKYLHELEAKEQHHLDNLDKIWGGARNVKRVISRVFNFIN